MAQQSMTPAELRARLAQAIEAVNQGKTSAQALQAAFGDRRYLGAAEIEQIEQRLEVIGDEARRAIPRPDRTRRFG